MRLALTPLTTCAIWLFHLCLGNVISLEPANSWNTSSDLSNDIKQHIFSSHFRRVVFDLYNKNFTNFPDITHVAEIGDDLNFNADVLLGLHDAMSEAHHTDMPFRAYKLYEKIEAHINNSNLTLLNPEKLQELERVREELLFKTIVPKGAHILESAVYTNACNKEGTAVRKLLDLLHLANQTIANLIIDDMITRVRWTLSLQEIIPILADMSPYVEQNVDILLALYDQGALQEDENLNVLRYLVELRKSSDYEGVTNEKKLKVNEITLLQYPPHDITSLDQLSGWVCFYQNLSDGNRRYLRECDEHYGLCTYDYVNATSQDVFDVEFDVKARTLVLRSRYNGRLCFDPNNNEIRSSYVKSECKEIIWNPQFQDGNVELKTYNDNYYRHYYVYLCANGILDEYTGESIISNLINYGTDKIECKWFVDDCNHII